VSQTIHIKNKTLIYMFLIADWAEICVDNDGRPGGFIG